METDFFVHKYFFFLEFFPFHMDENWNLYVYASFKEIRTSLFLRIIANIYVNGMQRQNFTEKKLLWKQQQISSICTKIMNSYLEKKKEKLFWE